MTPTHDQHSALVLSQNDGVRPLRWLCFYTFVDIACALSVAMLINTALLIVAAATFNSTGAAVLTLQVRERVHAVCHFWVMC